MTIRTRALSRNRVLVPLVAVLCGLAALAVPAFAAAETFTVNSTGDQAQQTPGSTTCASTASTCTLRAAIEAADAGTGEDEIAFAASFNGELTDTISLGSALPAITAPKTVIHGEPVVSGAPLPCATAAGKSGPCVGVSGPSGGTSITVDAELATVEGIAFSGSSLAVKATEEATTMVVSNNWIGTKLDGTAAAVTTGVELIGAANVEENTIHGGAVGIHVTNTATESASVGTIVQGNVIDSTTGSGILVENEQNQILGNRITGAGAAGIRVHSNTFSSADENAIGGSTAIPLTEPSENVIDDSQGAAIEVNTVQAAKSNRILRNSGSGNTEAFIKLVKANGAESKAPNNNIQPPTISVATATGAGGTALPETVVRVYAKSVADPGELGAYLGQVEADGAGAWSITYTAPAGTTHVAASQTPEEEELGSSALSIKGLPFSLTVTKAGTGSGTVTGVPTGIDCGTSCTALFDAGTLVTLVGTEASGSKPVVWTGCDSVNGTNGCLVTVGGAKSVTATFDLVPSDNGGGSGGGSTGSGDSSSSTSGGSAGPGASTSTATTKTASKALQCKAGFKKKKVKGHLRCVKVQKPKHHKHG